MPLAQASDPVLARPKPSLRARLRQSTGAAHERLDAIWRERDLTEPATYACYLASLAAVLVPLELALEQAGVAALLPDWPGRRRSDALCADLAAVTAGGYPRLPPVDLGGAAEMIGALYVLEGSRLGAALIGNRLQTSGDALVRDNGRFLRHGAGQAHWPSFLPLLDAAPPEQHEAICAQANAVFAAFEAAARLTLRELDA